MKNNVNNLGDLFAESTQSILNVLLGRQYGNHQAKELSESMAMVVGTWNLFESLSLDVLDAEMPVHVYVLGDGKVLVYCVHGI